MAADRDDSKVFDGTNIESLPRWLRDFFDLQNEAAGRDTGRMRRFYSEDRFAGPNSEKKKTERAFNALMRLLQDPHYARLYSDAVNAVTRADKAIRAALDEIARETAAARQHLDQIRQSAAQLPDGTKVYQSERDGHLYAEDGSIVDDRREFVSGLSESSPSWERRQTATTRVETLETERQGLETIRRDRVEAAKERFADTESPPSEDELEYIKSIKDALPGRALDKLNQMEIDGQTASVPSSNSAADEILGSYQSPAPNATTAFKTAHDGIPDSLSTINPRPTHNPKQ